MERAAFCASGCVRAVGGKRDHDVSESNLLDQNLPGGSGHLQASPRSKVQGRRSAEGVVQGQRREARGSGCGPDTFANLGPGPGWSAKRDGTRCFTEKSRAKSPPTRLD